MARTLPLILLALAVGAGVGYLVGASREEPARAQRTPVEPRAPERPGDPEPDALPGGDSDLAEALRALPIVNYPRGTGRFTGTVRDAAGQGVAGVTIRATQQGRGSSRRKGDDAPAQGSLEAAVRNAVRSYHWRRQTTVDAVTDASGSYVIESLADTDYSLRAYQKGRVINAKGGTQVWKVKPGATIDWIATTVVTVPVDVLLPDGSRPREAWVECKQANTSTSESWTRERPEIRVAPGLYTVSVRVGGNTEYRSDSFERTIEADRAPEPMTFQLKGRPGIRGTVRFSSGEAFSSVQVYALRYASDEAPTIEQLGALGKQTWIWSHNNFEFQFMDLPAGRYLVGVGSRKGSIFSTATVDVADHVTKTELVVEHIDPAHYVLVRVVGPDGKPLVVDQLSTSYRSGNSSSSGGGTWARRADGAYLVFHHSHEMEEGGTYGVEVTAKKYGKREVEYQRGEQKELEVRFRESATVAVVVSGFAGAEHADKISVGLRRRTGERRWTGVGERQAPDAEGRVVLGPVEFGDYEVVLYIRTGGRSGAMPGAREEVTLSAGENAATLAIPRLHDLVVSGRKGQRFRLSGDRGAGLGFHQSQRCTNDGKATFGALPAGRYTLRADNAPGEMTVTVPGPPVTFQATEYNALKVTIDDAEGTLAKAGLLDGDLVVGVNGTTFKGTAQMQLAFAGAMSKGEATLTIVRGGRSIEITANLRDVIMGTGGKPGGRVQPTTR